MLQERQSHYCSKSFCFLFLVTSSIIAPPWEPFFHITESADSGGRDGEMSSVRPEIAPDQELLEQHVLPSAQGGGKVETAKISHSYPTRPAARLGQAQSGGSRDDASRAAPVGDSSAKRLRLLVGATRE